MRPHAVAALAAAALLTGCGGEGDGPFAYDTDEPLAVERGPEVPADDRVVVDELTYASGDDQVDAYLVAPRRGTGPMPAVVFLHGAGGDREEQLGLATELAGRGALALTLTAPSRRKSPPTGAEPAQLLRWQRDTIVADVVAARRALDVLGADDRVDADRLGLVGWSMGGRLAAIVADVDDRVRATVLVSAGAVPVDEYVEAAPLELRDDVQDVLSPIDPLTHVRTIDGALFVQAGRADAIVPERALRSLAHAAPDGTRVSWYDADHALNTRAERDRLDWLAARLEVAKPS